MSDTPAVDNPNPEVQLAVPEPPASSETESTQLQKYLDGLEGPKDGDNAIIDGFQTHFEELRDLDSSVHIYDLLDTQPEVQKAFERKDNQYLKERLPIATRVLKELITRNPRFNIVLEDSRDRRFLQKRAHDLKLLLDLNFTPPPDGSLGQAGEQLLLKMIAAIHHSSAAGSELRNYVDRYQQSNEATHSGIAEHELFVKKVHASFSRIAEIADERYPSYSSPPNLDDFARRVDPPFYLAYENHIYFGSPNPLTNLPPPNAVTVSATVMK